MISPPDELFESSKMSFSDHLNELRATLLYCLAAIAVGFGVSLYFAGDFVKVISAPLKDAVDRYEVESAQEQQNSQPKGVAAEAHQGLKPRQVFVARDLLRADQAAAATPDGLVPITIWEPIADAPQRVITTSVTQGFSVYVKAALVLGVILASPVVFGCIWRFVAAGLYPHERRYVLFFSGFSLVLFLAGAALAFFVAIRYVLDFLFLFNRWLDIAPYPVISDWMGFILILPLGFGISFQLPLVMLFLERIGVFTAEVYLRQWRMAILVISIISTVLTPADPQSMLLMAVPLVFLYFGGILLCRCMPARPTVMEMPTGDLTRP